MTNLELLKQMIGSSIVTIKFTKLNGEVRTLNGRIGVRKHLKGGELKYDAENEGNLIIYDLQNKGYRTIKVDNILEIKYNNKTLSFD